MVHKMRHTITTGECSDHVNMTAAMKRCSAACLLLINGIHLKQLDNIAEDPVQWTRASFVCLQTTAAGTVSREAEKKRKEKFTLFSDHNGSLPTRQPGAMTIGYSPKGKQNS